MAPLVVIVGETASGKSALAMEVAKKYNGEIICADSRTIFKGMNIGTAKPSMQDQLEVPHHLLNVVNPDEQFTVVDFKKQAEAAIEQICARGHLPIIVGGTGLYVDAVLFNYQFAPKPSPELRGALKQLTVDELKAQLDSQGVTYPEAEKNKRHLIRILERGGMPENNRTNIRDNTLVVGLSIPRAELRQRIYDRVQQMMDQGILDEVRTIGEQYGWSSEAMTANIYRIFAEVIRGRKRVGDAMAEAAQADIYLAKRQRTWFKRNLFIQWQTSGSEARHVIEQFLASRI